MRMNELILYKDMEDGELLQDMTFLMENYNNAVSYTHLDVYKRQTVQRQESVEML